MGNLKLMTQMPIVIADIIATEHKLVSRIARRPQPIGTRALMPESFLASYNISSEPAVSVPPGATSAFPANCGDGFSTVNTTTIQIPSKSGLAPLASIDQGAYWKACRHTPIVDGSSNKYYMSLARRP